MRKPSSRVLKNTVDLYSGTLTPDTEGGPGWSYPTIPMTANVRCSVQPMETTEVIDEQGRLTQVRDYEIMFASDPGLKPRDKIIWRDVTPNRTLFYQAVDDQAGREAAFVAKATERL